MNGRWKIYIHLNSIGTFEKVIKGLLYIKFSGGGGKFLNDFKSSSESFEILYLYCGKYSVQVAEPLG